MFVVVTGELTWLRASILFRNVKKFLLMCEIHIEALRLCLTQWLVCVSADVWAR